MALSRWLALAAVVFALDQLSKYAALKHLVNGEVAVAPFLNLVLTFNTGAAFGFLNDAGGWQNAFFIGVATLVSVAIVYMLRQLRSDQKFVAVALMLVLGGALGNLLDRIRFGHVVDFIDFYYRSWHWYTFNVADSAITVGAVMLALDALGVSARKKPA